MWDVSPPLVWAVALPQNSSRAAALVQPRGRSPHDAPLLSCLSRIGVAQLLLRTVLPTQPQRWLCQALHAAEARAH